MMKLSKQFICATKEKSALNQSIPSPYIRKDFSIEKPIKSISMTICGLGFYRFYLNGKEYTKGFLSPYISNPNDIIEYDLYDLTHEVKMGANVIAFALGNGMQNSYGGYVWDFNKADFCSSPCLAICLSITYSDDSIEEIQADESFLCTSSPLLADDLRMGEIYDANKEIAGWNEVEFNDKDWTHAIKAKTPKGEARLCDINPIKERERLYPISVCRGKWITSRREKAKIGYIYDFSKNTSGIIRLFVHGKKNQKITLTFGEILKEGDFYTDNISFIRPEYKDYPDYIQQDVYICKGGEEEYTPSFTYHGFRYVFVEGITKEQATKDLLVFIVMNTELKEFGNFHSSDAKLNQLQEMARNSTLSNFFHFPTDCPHREKNGWTADAALSSEHTLLNWDVEKNYTEWLRHVAKAQDQRGALPGIIPTGGWGFEWGNGPAWDCVLVEIPYMVYKYTGKKEIVEESIDAVYRYIKYLETRKDEKGLIAIGLGDWCAPKGIKSPLVFTDTVVSMNICEKAAFLSAQIKRKEYENYFLEQAKQYRKNIREHLIDGAVAVGKCQTSEAMAIYYNVFEEEEKPKAFQKLLEYIEKEKEHLDTGMLGGRVLFHVLCQFGKADLAYKMIVDPTPPSYGYWIEKGYTSLAEDMCIEEKHINSRNHHCWGDISALFIKEFVGIDYNPNADNLSFVRIHPKILENVQYAKAYHRTPKGKIAVEWEKMDRNRAEIRIEIPKDMKREISLPNGYKKVRERQVKTDESQEWLSIEIGR